MVSSFSHTHFMHFPDSHNKSTPLTSDGLFVRVVEVEVDLQADVWEQKIGGTLTEAQRRDCVDHALTALQEDLTRYGQAFEVQPDVLTERIQREVIFAIFRILTGARKEN